MSKQDVELAKQKGEDNRKMLWVIGLLLAGGFFLFAGDHIVDEYVEGDCSKSPERIVYNNHEYKCMGGLDRDAIVVESDDVGTIEKVVKTKK